MYTSICSSSVCSNRKACGVVGVVDVDVVVAVVVAVVVGVVAVVDVVGGGITMAEVGRHMS